MRNYFTRNEPLPCPADRRTQDDLNPSGGRSKAAAVEAPDPNRWIILVGLVMSVIMEALDTTSINVALPQMGGNLGATPNEIGGSRRVIFWPW